MKTQTTKLKNFNGFGSTAAKATLTAVAALIAGAGFLSGVAAGATFNNVQISVSTSASLPYSYVFTAYNLTGDLVGTYQGPYPAAAFELPTGDYLFTVSAIHQYGSPCNICMLGAASGAPSSSIAAMPVKYFQPTAEYGYAVQHVDSSQTIDIKTQNVTQYPTTQITVTAVYQNGTAAVGAWISSSVVGQWYYWWGQDTKILMSAQTGSDGVATLVIPSAPAVVTAWSWVPVNLPTNQTTVVTNVGGQKVNVTVYWQPTYVGLSASVLLLPPSTSAKLTLHYQPQNYWVMPAGVKSAGGTSGTGTTSSQPTGVPAQTSAAASQRAGTSQYYTPSNIPTLSVQAPTSGGSQGTQSYFGVSSTELLLSVAVFAAAVAGVLGLVFLRRTRKLSAL
ncbi:MAG: hypothetical protein OK438_01940 [Thaumarchaeota archaeon]|nr:hypothetical protein [Nitrososphaerota archaeon]